MIAATDIQNAYINLYKELRKYIWSAEMIEAIADLEISVYEMFPNMNIVRKNFKKVKSNLYEALHSDDEENVELLKEAVDEFEKASEDEIGFGRLAKVQEVI